MNYEKGDIVQITDEGHHWFPCLIVVDKPKSWGVRGYVTFPKKNSGDVRSAYIRLDNNEITKVGSAQVLAE